MSLILFLVLSVASRFEQQPVVRPDYEGGVQCVSIY